MTETMTIPPETSRDSKRNAFYVRCDAVGHARPYAVCLNLCNERSDGRLESIYADCSVHIGKKRCPALAMQRQEKEAGKALYFIERIKAVGEAFVTKARGLAGMAVPVRETQPEITVAAKTKPSKSAPIVKSSVIDNIDDAGYSTALNSVTEERVVATPLPKTEANEGESLLALAKRLMAQKKGQ